MFDTPVLPCENEKEIAEQLANFVVMCYNEAVEERGRFAIALSSGRAVSLLAQRLTEEPFISYIDWTKWYVFFVDERCTSLDNPCSSYYMVDQVLLQHVRIPEMQVYPAYDPLLSLDKRGHTCEAAALAYEQRMRSVLGEDNGIPALDVLLVGADAQGNVASLFENHPMTQHKIRNFEVTWGAEGKLRALGAQQAVCAMYECQLDLIDVVLTPEQMAAAKRRGIPAERVALTLKAINHAHQVLVTVADPLSGPLMKEYFEGPRPGEEPRYASSGLNLLRGRTGRPKLFAHRKAIDGFIALPQLLRTFQVQDLAFSITEAREATNSTAASTPPASDSDSEGEEYVRRLEREEEERLSAYNKSRTGSRSGSKHGSPMASSPMTPMRRMSSKKFLTGNPSTGKTDVSDTIAEGEGGSFSRAASLGRTRSTASNRSRGKGDGHVSLQEAHVFDIEAPQELLPCESASQDGPIDGDVIVPDHFSSLPEAIRHVQTCLRLARGAAMRAAQDEVAQDEVGAESGPGSGNDAAEVGHPVARGMGVHRAEDGLLGRRRPVSVGRGTWSSLQAAEEPELTQSRRIYIRSGCHSWKGLVTVDCSVDIVGEGRASCRMAPSTLSFAAPLTVSLNSAAVLGAGLAGNGDGIAVSEHAASGDGGGGRDAQGGDAAVQSQQEGLGADAAHLDVPGSVEMEWGGAGNETCGLAARPRQRRAWRARACTPMPGHGPCLACRAVLPDASTALCIVSLCRLTRWWARGP